MRAIVSTPIRSLMAAVSGTWMESMSIGFVVISDGTWLARSDLSVTISDIAGDDLHLEARKPMRHHASVA